MKKKGVKGILSEQSSCHGQHWAWSEYLQSQSLHRDWIASWIATKDHWLQTPLPTWLLVKGFFCYDSKLKEVIRRAKHSFEHYGDLAAMEVWTATGNNTNEMLSQQNLGSSRREGKYPASNTGRLHIYIKSEEGPQNNAVLKGMLDKCLFKLLWALFLIHFNISLYYKVLCNACK